MRTHGFYREIVDRDAVLENMTEAATHRGPDSKGFYTDDKISMGFQAEYYRPGQKRKPADL